MVVGRDKEGDLRARETRIGRELLGVANGSCEGWRERERERTMGRSYKSNQTAECMGGGNR